MNDERLIPTPAPADRPTFTILSDGEVISEEYQVAAISVTKMVNKIPSAVIHLLDGDTASSDFKVSNTDFFLPGKEIEILAGYHSDEETIFKGIIINHGIKARQNRPSALIIECKDAAVKMTVGRKSAYYADAKDSEALEEIIREYGLTTDVAATETTYKEIVKFYTTDWDFLLTRAEANSRLVIVDDGTVAVKKPDTSQDPALALVYGSTMMDFEASMDARHQYAGVKSSAWDFASQEMLAETADEPEFSSSGNVTASDLADVIGLESLNLQHSGQVTDQELKAWADAQLLKSRLAKIIGKVKCQGFAAIKPGNMINLNGVGERFNGVAYVTAVRQQIDTKNWETHIQFGLSPEWFSRREAITEPPAAGLLPGINGLQIGLVTQLGEDPDGEDRVLVRLPVIDPQAEGVWARVATLDAGENRGSFFRPEIGDEVVLGFLNDDPRDPVILGMLNSSAKPAPLTANDDNHEKGFITRSDIKWIFNDDEISLKIETPNGNKITISDDAGGITLEDENSNKIVMDSGGITIESASDINIKASGNIKLEGTDVTAYASGQFKGEGSSGAEVSSGGTTVLKGSLVQIN